MSMRKTPKEILYGVDHGFGEEAWEDLASDFNYTGDENEDRALLVLCARFLEKKFPEETFGWQDFDILISDRFVGRWDSRVALAGQVLGEDMDLIKDPQERAFRKAQLDALTDEELVSTLFSRPGWHALDTYDEKGGIVAFHNVLGIESVTRI